MTEQDQGASGTPVAESAQRCGYVALVGRPNVGKSTLLNALVGQKLAITSEKPQTTRHTLLGIRTEGADQIVFVDTPGMHRDAGRAMNRYMNRAARSVLADVDVVVMVVEGDRWNDDDAMVLEAVQEAGATHKLICALNKMDLMGHPDQVLPVIDKLRSRAEFRDIVPLSARRGNNLDGLLSCIGKALPTAVHLFPEDQVTDRSVRFMVAEIIREKLMRQLGEELPYRTTVAIEQFREDTPTLTIHATIYVERAGQKAIVIGAGGSRLRRVGIDARKDIEALVERKVMLETWVKVRPGWSDDDSMLRNLGYD